jgi:uncharacterized protein YjdB
VTAVYLDKSSANLVAGGSTLQLSAILSPLNPSVTTVTWLSSNTSVASVTAGLVTPLAAGSTIITVTSVDGGFKDYCTVTVTSSAVSVTGASLNKSRTTLSVGSTEELVASVLPSNATNTNVTWATSDSSKVSVTSSGTITGVAAGTATITVTSSDGSKTATCDVTVYATTYSVSSISLNKSSTTVLKGNTETLYVTFNPVFATNQDITWISSDSTKVIVSEGGLITGVDDGTATVTATSGDGNKTATCSVTVTSTASPVTGISLSLSKTTALIVPGGCEQLTAVITPSGATNQNLVWASADTGKVTVDQTGLIKGVAVTSSAVNVTVTSVDGSYFASCAVTVSNTPNDWGDIKGSSDAKILVACAGSGQSNPGIWVSGDYGYTWKQVSTTPAWAMAITSDGHYAIVVNTGTLLTSSDYGATWTNRTTTTGVTFTGKYLQGAAISDDGQTMWISEYSDSGSGAVFRSLNGGSAFAAVGSASTSKYNAITCSSDGATVGVGTVYASGTYKYTTNGEATTPTWTSTSSSSIGFPSVANSTELRTTFISKSGTQVLVGNQAGYLRQSPSSGTLWTTWASFDIVASPVARSWGGYGFIYNSDGTFKTIYASVGTNTSDWNCIIYKTNDLGTTWTTVAAANTWRGVTPSSDGKIIVATSASTTAGGIYVAIDGDQTTPTFVRRY